MQSVNPATGETIRTWPTLSSEELRQRLETASKAQQTWARVTVQEKTGRLEALGGTLLSRRRELAELMTLEMGKPIDQALAEIDKCVYACEYYAKHAVNMLQPEKVLLNNKTCYVRFDALGLTLAIMPWNFPFWQVFRQAVPAVVAGNAVLLKHAANVPGCATAIQEVFEQAGLGQGIFSTLLIEHEQVPIILEHSRVQVVSLTGSEKAASVVASQAAGQIKKTILELGGSDPFIVLEDADIEYAVDQAVKARIQNSGQSCIAAKRFLVSEKIAERFTEQFVARMKSLKVGDPLDPSNEVGPLARPDLVETLHRQVEQSIASGARLACGGAPLPSGGCFYQPTVLTDVEPGMAAFDEETFGPVAAVCVVEDDDDKIIALANHSSFGLGASLWSDDRPRAERFAERLECGSVFVNQMVQSDPHLPFGGVKLSGYGRELGDFGLREFTNVKTVCVA